MPISITPKNRARMWLQQQKSIPTDQGDVLVVAGLRVLGPFTDENAAKAKLKERGIADIPHFFSLAALIKMPRVQTGTQIGAAVIAKNKKAKMRPR